MVGADRSFWLLDGERIFLVKGESSRWHRGQKPSNARVGPVKASGAAATNGSAHRESHRLAHVAHLSGFLLAKRAGIEATHVPDKNLYSSYVATKRPGATAPRNR